jgi:hypothetical protein
MPNQPQLDLNFSFPQMFKRLIYPHISLLFVHGFHSELSRLVQFTHSSFFFCTISTQVDPFLHQENGLTKCLSSLQSCTSVHSTIFYRTVAISLPKLSQFGQGFGWKYQLQGRQAAGGEDLGRDISHQQAESKEERTREATSS